MWPVVELRGWQGSSLGLTANCDTKSDATHTGPEAWTTFCEAASQWGLPVGVLSDNGLCFSGKLRGFEVLFEANLRDAGIRPITRRAYHPQTTGKVERFQQTLKLWLRHQDRQHGLAANLAELQNRLDEFCDYYNHQRPHQGIGRVTPISRWQASTAATPDSTPLPHPKPRPETHTVVVDDRGAVNLHRLSIAVGAESTASTIDAHYATILCDNQIVRHLRIDHTRYYQPSGRRPGGPRRTRHLAS